MAGFVAGLSPARDGRALFWNQARSTPPVAAEDATRSTVTVVFRECLRLRLDRKRGWFHRRSCQRTHHHYRATGLPLPTFRGRGRMAGGMHKEPDRNATASGNLAAGPVFFCAPGELVAPRI